MGTLIIKPNFRPFILTVKTDNLLTGSSASDQVTIPHYAVSGDKYSYFIDWGDGTRERITGATSPVHTYASAGTYDIKIKGIFYGFNSGLWASETGDQGKYLDIKQWGDVRFNSLNKAFGRSSNLTMSATDNVNASLVDTSIIGVFDVTKVSRVPFDARLNNASSITAAFRNTLVSVLPVDWNPTLLNNSTYVFKNCTNLTTVHRGFLSGVFGTASLNYIGFFVNCALTQESVDNALLDVSEAAVLRNLNVGTLEIIGGTNATPSATGQTAADALRARGWTVLLNGY